MSGITINSSIPALWVQRKLSQTQSALAKGLERLSSGMRINRASDDAAGLAIAQSMNAEARVYGQAMRNINDGLSLLNVAEGALHQLSAILIRHKELAAQAANGTFSLAQRRAIHAEAESLVEEYNRIVSSTEFNDIALFDSNTQSLRIQAGWGEGGSIEVALGEALARTVGDGTFQDCLSIAVGDKPQGMDIHDFNRDGIMDVMVGEAGGHTIGVMLGNGDGTFRARASFVSCQSFGGGFEVGDLNRDGHLDVIVFDVSDDRLNVLLGNGDGTFQARLSFEGGNGPNGTDGLADFNNDGILDAACGDRYEDSANLWIGNGNGTFKARISFQSSDGPYYAAPGDVNGDGNQDLMICTYGDNKVDVLLGNGDGTLRTRISLAASSTPRNLQVSDLNYDGFLDLAVSDSGNASVSVYIGNGDGNFRARSSFACGTLPRSVAVTDFNGDGFSDLALHAETDNSLDILLGNGDGTFKAAQSFPVGNRPKDLAAGDLNGDGVPDLASSAYDDDTVHILLANTDSTAAIAHLNLTTAAEARAAMAVIDQNFERVSAELASIGAAQSRLSTALAAVSASRENCTLAYSRIMDADVAEEMAQVTKERVLQAAGAAVLAQANQMPQLALRLLSS